MSNPDVMSHEAQLALLNNTQTHMMNALNRIEETVQALQKSGVESTIQAVEMNSRISSLEKSMTANAPTIQEFITIKHKVQGAGFAGKWVWAGASALITMLVTSKTAIFNFFTGG